jgi:protein kinase-like protein
MLPLTIGTEFAGYRIERLAGDGGMGVVYRARHVELDQPRALKAISPALAVDEGFRQRFRREWRIAAAIEHPNVIPMYDAGESDGRLFIVMRLVDGADLAGIIAHGGARPPARRRDRRAGRRRTRRGTRSRSGAPRCQACQRARHGRSPSRSRSRSRAWQRAINRGHDARAASYFALPASFDGARYATFRALAQAQSNLGCGTRRALHVAAGDAVTVTTVADRRPGHICSLQYLGRTFVYVVTVSDGKIVDWRVSG